RMSALERAPAWGLARSGTQQAASQLRQTGTLHSAAENGCDRSSPARETALTLRKSKLARRLPVIEIFINKTLTYARSLATRPAQQRAAEREERTEQQRPRRRAGGDAAGRDRGCDHEQRDALRWQRRVEHAAADADVGGVLNRARRRELPDARCRAGREARELERERRRAAQVLADDHHRERAVGAARGGERREGVGVRSRSADRDL